MESLGSSHDQRCWERSKGEGESTRKDKKSSGPRIGGSTKNRYACTGHVMDPQEAEEQEIKK